jgi:[acyl-carrier-protein] S-malonyltransferase
MDLISIGLFPGQGSQQAGMGKDLYNDYNLARDLFQRADNALGFSLSSICFEGSAEELTKTDIAQPALLVVSTILFNLTRERTQIVAGLGHSLGEYSALVAAEAIDFEEAVVLVHKRGQYMQAAVPLGAGGMVAVLGRDLSDIERVIASLPSGDGLVVEVANINSPQQIIVSGNSRGIECFKDKMAGARLVDLPVSAPFHCSLMQPASEKLREDLKRTKITTPRFPILSNYYAKSLTDPEEIREALYLQVCGKVRFTECLAEVIDNFKTFKAIEFGNGKILASLAKRINSELDVTNAYDIL